MAASDAVIIHIELCISVSTLLLTKVWNRDRVAEILGPVHDTLAIHLAGTEKMHARAVCVSVQELGAESEEDMAALGQPYSRWIFRRPLPFPSPAWQGSSAQAGLQRSSLGLSNITQTLDTPTWGFESTSGFTKLQDVL